jgi:hypothetical protein
MAGAVDPLIEALLACRLGLARVLSRERSDPVAIGARALLGGDLEDPHARDLLRLLWGLWRDSTGTNARID